MLQRYGPISAGGIRNEFMQGNPMSVSRYYRGAGIVMDLVQNYSIPTGPIGKTIKYSDFYGTGNFLLSVTFTRVMHETTSEYQNSDNGYVQFYLSGTSDSYTILCSNGAYGTYYNNTTITFNGLNGNVTYNITVKENTFNYVYQFIVYIGYGSGSSVYRNGSPLSLNVAYDLPAGASPQPAPPVRGTALGETPIYTSGYQVGTSFRYADGFGGSYGSNEYYPDGTEVARGSVTDSVYGQRWSDDNFIGWLTCTNYEALFTNGSGGLYWSWGQSCVDSPAPPDGGS
jgi:hypothetical protein